MGGKKSAIVELFEQLQVLIVYGVLCVSKDVDLIAAHLQEALERDQEQRGHGIRREPWCLDTFAVQEIEPLFRFKTKDDIRYLMDSLDFPPDEYWVTPSGTRFAREEAITFYLRRMMYPTKLRLVHREGFKAQIGALSELYTMVSDWLYENHTHRLLQTGLTKWAHRVPGYALAIQAYTGIPWRCFGFIDGTSRGVAKPGFWQREFYSGHKRHHCLQFLSITGQVHSNWENTVAGPSTSFLKKTEKNPTFFDFCDILYGARTNSKLPHRYSNCYSNSAVSIQQFAVSFPVLLYRYSKLL